VVTKKADKRRPKRSTARKLKLKKETLKDLRPGSPSDVKGGWGATVACPTIVGCLSKDPAVSCVPCNSVSCLGGACLMK
jgi:hypothetical protein